MQKLGKQTIKFNTPPVITEVASIVGPKEANGPLAKYFDQCLEDEFWGEKTWEKAESKIIKETVNILATEGWEYTFENLPEKSNGKTINYLFQILRRINK